MTRPLHRLRPAPAALGSLALALGAALLASCNIVGPAAYFVAGPTKVKPQYVLPKNKPAVIFIDDRASVLPSRTVRQRIARAAEKVLLEDRALGKADLISSDAILSVSAQERFGKPLGIAEVGKAVGASTVIYATIDSFTLSPDGQEFAPTAAIRVKVIDTDSRARLWPTEDREWTPVTIAPPTKSSPAPATTADRTKAEFEFGDKVGQTIGGLFVEHLQEDIAKRVGE